MKAFLMVLTLGLSLNAYAASDLAQWADFEPGDALTLKNDLVVSDTFTLKAGTQVVVHETTTLDPVPVMLFSVRLTPCEAAMDVGPIELTMLPGNINGFEYARNCTASFYVEFSDLYTDSYFTRTP
jgi:hypothetical protein